MITKVNVFTEALKILKENNASPYIIRRIERFLSNELIKREYGRMKREHIKNK